MRRRFKTFQTKKLNKRLIREFIIVLNRIIWILFSLRIIFYFRPSATCHSESQLIIIIGFFCFACTILLDLFEIHFQKYLFFSKPAIVGFGNGILLWQWRISRIPLCSLNSISEHSSFFFFSHVRKKRIIPGATFDNLIF